MVDSVFSKQKLLCFTTMLRNLKRAWYVPKSSFLEILRSPLLTGAAGLQCTVCKTTKNEVLTMLSR